MGQSFTDAKPGFYKRYGYYGGYRFGFGKRAVNPKKGYEKKEDIPKNNSEPPSYYKSSGNVKREAIPLPDTEHGYYRNYGNGYSESYL